MAKRMPAARLVPVKKNVACLVFAQNLALGAKLMVDVTRIRIASPKATHVLAIGCRSTNARPAQSS